MIVGAACVGNANAREGGGRSEKVGRREGKGGPGF